MPEEAMAVEEAFPELRPVLDWVVEQGIGAVELAPFVTELGQRLMAVGLPMWRMHVSFPTLDPVKRGENVIWLRDGRSSADSLDHERFDTAFRASPFPEMIRTNRLARRWRLTSRASAEGYAVIEGLWEAGATDYIVRLTSFGQDEGALMGVAISAATDRAGGFTGREVRALASIVPTVALAAYRITLSSVMRRVLSAYIGRDAGQHVLGGNIRRGEGYRVTAALMFADLRGFTAATEAAGAGVIPRLGLHLSAMAEPVEQAGGEVLKFLGDGLLAAFPVMGPIAGGAACGAALDATIEALARTELVNRDHPEEAPLDLDVALHLGEVFYGNVGAGSRLDFTVIGPAVNEASRIEALCGTLGRNLLMSAPFANLCGRPTVSLGLHTLRGLPDPREIFGLA